jgi:hypothetical protein
LLLQRDVPRALHRGHEPREIFLLCFNESNALFLQLQSPVEQVAYMLLIGLARRGHLQAKLSPRFALLHGKLIELGSKASVGLLQLCHLRVGQSDARLRKPGNALAKLLLEGGPVRLGVTSANGLTKRSRCAQPEQERH